MPAPSPLSIATSALTRLVKEEASYHRELKQQQGRVDKLEAELKSGAGDAEGEEGNAEYMIKQEKLAMEETRAIFPNLEKRIETSIETLESQLEAAGDSAPEAEVQKAKDILAQAKSRDTTA